MSGPVAAAYAELLSAGELKTDPDQQRAVQALEAAAAKIEGLASV